jgi:hypothetical protein
MDASLTASLFPRGDAIEISRVELSVADHCSPEIVVLDPIEKAFRPGGEEPRKLGIVLA